MVSASGAVFGDPAMKFWTMLLVPALVLAMVGVAEAKGKHASSTTGHKHATKAPHISGKIVSVATDGTSIVIKEGKKKGGQEVTVTTDASTKVTIDKVKGKAVTDLTPGMHVKVTPTTGTATKIKAHTKHKHTHGHHKPKNA
jgi:hypothetical protein